MMGLPIDKEHVIRNPGKTESRALMVVIHR